MSKVAGLREEIIAKQKALGEVFASKPERDFTDEEVADLRAKNAELNDLGERLEGAQEIEEIASRHAVKGAIILPGRSPDPAPVAPKTLGQMFVESPAFREFDATQKRGPSVEIDLASVSVKAALGGIKTVLDEAGFVPETTRVPGLFVTPGEQQPTIASLFASGRTGQTSVVYMEETTTTNAAAETSEKADKPESALAFTERTSAVRKIATVLPVTSELMEDAAAMQDYVNGRLGQFIAYREDSQMLVGDGNAPNLRGVLNVVNVQTQAKGADPTPDAVYKAITKVATGSFLPADAAVFHPLDWQDVRLLRTADGVYIWGSPADTGPSRIWGLNVVITTAITQNTALVGAFRAAGQVFRRSDVSLAVSDSHSDFFIKNQLMIRAEERLALVIYRPTAFCMVTGI